MGTCQYGNCSGDADLSHQCSYCNAEFCKQHHLPENHNCAAVQAANTLSPDFRTGHRQTDESPDGQTDRKRKQCSECSNYISPEKQLCLSCRRKKKTMSTTSPDVTVDGSLAPDEDDRQLQDSISESSGPSILSRITSRIYGRRVLNKFGYRGRIHQFFIQYRYAFVAVTILLLLALITTAILGISIVT